MELGPLATLLAVVVMIAVAPLLPQLLRIFRTILRLAVDSGRGQPRTRDTLELALRLRLLLHPDSPPECKPQFWLAIEYQSMPERSVFDICAAYQDLRAAGIAHEAVIERLEIWRSRFATGGMQQGPASLDDYIRGRLQIEHPALPALSSGLIAIQRNLFLRQARARAERQSVRSRQAQSALQRRLYVIRTKGADLALDDSTQLIPIGWTDLETYLESDSCAARVIEGDEIWSYSTPRAAGLALVRKGSILELSELANFSRRHAQRPRRDGRR